MFGSWDSSLTLCLRSGRGCLSRVAVSGSHSQLIMSSPQVAVSVFDMIVCLFRAKDLFLPDARCWNTDSQWYSSKTAVWCQHRNQKSRCKKLHFLCCSRVSVCLLLFTFLSTINFLFFFIFHFKGQ